MLSSREALRWEELEGYDKATPLGRFWINYWRRRHGQAPFRLREVRAELRAIYARIARPRHA